MTFRYLLLTVASLACVHAQASDHPYEVWAKQDYPNPQDDSNNWCRRGGPEKKSFVCNPNANMGISSADADELDKEIFKIMNLTTCPCSDFVCHKRTINKKPQGYRVGIALLEKMQRKDKFDPNKPEDMSTKAIMDDAARFSHYVMNSWNFGECGEMILLLYSMRDNVVFISTQPAAKKVLSDQSAVKILENSQRHFGPGRGTFEGLKQILKDLKIKLGAPQDKYIYRPIYQRTTSGAGSLNTYNFLSALLITFLSMGLWL